MSCRKSYTTCFPVKRDLTCYNEPNERHNKTGNKSNAPHQWTYGLSVSILHIRTVADSGSRVCFRMLHFCPVARVNLTISALCPRACCWSVPDTTTSNSLKDHMEQSSLEQSANSLELLATFFGYFSVTVMRHPSSWEILDLLVFRWSPIG